MAGLGEIEGVVRRGVEGGLVPAAVVSLWKGGREVGHVRVGRWEVFDLASLTKPLATALVVAWAVGRGLVDFTTTLGEIWGRAVPGDKRGITLAQLLSHTAGLPSWRPYYELLETYPPLMRRGLLKAMVMNEPLEAPPGHRVCYSDLGYMALGLVVEELLGMGLEEAVEELYREMGVQGPWFAQVRPDPGVEPAPTGAGPWQVHDRNARALGGVGGHAGLFGTAVQVGEVMGAYCRCVRSGGAIARWAARELMRPVEARGGPRRVGFDVPTAPESAPALAPRGTVGHLGFTGTSVWWVVGREMGVVMLTNRVALGDDHQGISTLRRQVHELAWEVLHGL